MSFFFLSLSLTSISLAGFSVTQGVSVKVTVICLQMKPELSENDSHVKSFPHNTPPAF